MSQSWDNVVSRLYNPSLAVAMARGTLLCVHGFTVLTNPELCSADFLSARAVHSLYSNRVHPRCVSMPSCIMTRTIIRKLSL